MSVRGARRTADAPRDVGASKHLTPIIWRRRDGYLFSEEPADWIEYEKKQFRIVLARLTRLITGTLDPHPRAASRRRMGFCLRITRPFRPSTTTSAWHRRGVIGLLRDQLRRQIRTGQGRCPWPVTLIVDSQSVKGAETVSRATRGFDVGRKINGRKRHIAVDTLGLPVMITVTPADTADRDAARGLLWRLRLMQPQITQVWADSAYGGQLINWSGDFLDMTLKTVSRPRGTKGFVVLPRRWKVERALGWILKARRNVRDYERLPQHSEAHLTWSLIILMTRRITRKGPHARWSKRA